MKDIAVFFKFLITHNIHYILYYIYRRKNPSMKMEKDIF